MYAEVRRLSDQSGGIPIVNPLVIELNALARELGIAPLTQEAST